MTLHVKSLVLLHSAIENIQSTNWQSLRFKVPPPNSDIGWRIEFRTMEIQLTDFENAAFAIFIILLSRAITALGVNFYIPISKVDINMERAQRRSAVTGEKFWFRKGGYPARASPPLPTQAAAGVSANGNKTDSFAEAALASAKSPQSAGRAAGRSNGTSHEDFEEMTVDEIINGKGDGFPGLLGLVNEYVATLNVDDSEKQKIGKYLDLIKRRANGSLLTTASWMRNFIRAHPKYTKDSVVNEEVNYDLIKALEQVEKGTCVAEDLLPGKYANSVREKA